MDFLRKIKNIKSSYKFSTGILVFSIMWIIGSQMIYGNNETVSFAEKPKKGLSKVTISKISPISTNKEIPVYGNIESTKKIDLLPRTSGKVKEIMTKSGSYLKKDEIILVIELDTRGEDVKQAKALLDQTRSEYNAAKSLAKKGYASSTMVAQKKAIYESALAAHEKSKLNLDNTEIRAPFDGFLDKILVDKGDIVSANDTKLASYIDNNSFVAVGYVSQRNRKDIREGQSAIIKINNSTIDGGLNFETKVIFVSKIANEYTKTYRVELEIPNKYLKDMLHGQITEIKVVSDEVIAYKIPSPSLGLNDDGVLGVKIVNDASIVEFIEVFIIKDSNEEVEVILKDKQKKSLNSDINLIILGQSYVRDGNEVEAKEDAKYEELRKEEESSVKVLESDIANNSDNDNDINN